MEEMTRLRPQLLAPYDHDGLEEYQKAYDLCVRIQALLPKVDHSEDWYGVAYHSNVLMNKLASRLKEE